MKTEGLCGYHQLHIDLPLLGQKKWALSLRAIVYRYRPISSAPVGINGRTDAILSHVHRRFKRLDWIFEHQEVDTGAVGLNDTGRLGESKLRCSIGGPKYKFEHEEATRGGKMPLK